MPDGPAAALLEVRGPAAMMRLGRRLAARLRAGDLLVLDGPLGAGKTTLTRGLGAGLGVRGEVTSPTFVIARQHTGTSGPGLVHVDAYRLAGAEDLFDLEIPEELDRAVVVVEWGAGKVDGIEARRLDLGLVRPADGEDVRLVRVVPADPQQWPAADWTGLADPVGSTDLDGEVVVTS